MEAQRAADATGIPHLSAAAEATIDAVRAAPDEKARAEMWQAVQKDERLAGELRTFGAAGEQRFGEEGVRAMLRAEGRPSAVIAPSVKPELDCVAGLTATLRQGERAAASVAQRQAESERQGPRRGLRM